MKESEAQHVQLAIGALVSEVVLTVAAYWSIGHVLVLFLLFLAVFIVGCWNMVAYITRFSREKNVRLGILICTLLPLAYSFFLMAYIDSKITVIN